MKIGFLLPTVFASKKLFPDRIFAPGDLARDTINGLVDRGHEVFVFSTPDFETKGKLIAGDMEPFEKKLTYSKLQRVSPEEARVRNDEVRKRSFEIAMTSIAYGTAKKEGIRVMHGYHDFLFTPHYLEDLTGIPTVYTLHDPLPPQGSFEYHEFNKFSRHNFVSISRAQQRSTLPLHFVDIVYHGVNPASFPFSASEKGYLAFVGRLVPEKGVEDGLRASEEVGMPLHIATSENFEESEYFTKTLKPRITSAGAVLTGFMHKPKRDEWMKAARALLFPIHWEEPFGMVMIEAMATGTPVIAYNRGSVSEIVKDGVTGFIVDEKEGVPGLVKAIKRIGEIDRAAARRHVEENFSVEKMVAGYETVYESILQKK